MYSAPLLGCV